MYNNMCGMCNLSIMESWCRSSSSLAAEMLTLYLRRHEATSPPRCPDTPAADWQSQGRPSAYACTHIQTHTNTSVTSVHQHSVSASVTTAGRRDWSPLCATSRSSRRWSSWCRLLAAWGWWYLPRRNSGYRFQVTRSDDGDASLFFLAERSDLFEKSGWVSEMSVWGEPRCFVVFLLVFV